MCGLRPALETGRSAPSARHAPPSLSCCPTTALLALLHRPALPSTAPAALQCWQLPSTLACQPCCQPAAASLLLPAGLRLTPLHGAEHVEEGLAHHKGEQAAGEAGEGGRVGPSPASGCCMEALPATSPRSRPLNPRPGAGALPAALWQLPSCKRVCSCKPHKLTVTATLMPAARVSRVWISDGTCPARERFLRV